jgi:hypothetical protein
MKKKFSTKRYKLSFTRPVIGFVASVLFAVSTFPATAQFRASVPPEIKIEKITAELVPSPNFQGAGTKKDARDAGNWLEIEVEFSVKTAKDAPEFIDELSVRYFVAFETDSLDGGALNPITGKALVGEVSHVDVKASMPGQSRFSSIFLSPRKLERFIGKKNLLPTNVNVGVEILMPGVPEPLATGSEGPVSARAKNWWSKVSQIPDVLLSREKTPFAPVSWGRYEPVKAAGSR